MNKIILFIIIAICSSTYAQEMEPRSYSNLPTGANTIIFSYAFSDGNIVSEAASPLQDLEITSHSTALVYMRTFGLFGLLSRVQTTVPFVYLYGGAKLRGNDTTASRTGFADIKLKFGINLLGSPAIAPKDFVRYQQSSILGFSFVLSAPTGQYYNDKLINLGTNRWGFKPEIGFSQRYKRFYFETFAGIWFFTVNKEYFKGNTLKQDPIFSIQGHLNYLFPSDVMVSVHGAYVHGGQTSLNSFVRDDWMNDSYIGTTAVVPVARGHIVRAQVRSSLNTKNSGSNYSLSVGYQYIWF
jgi:hypothetical protein